MQFNAHCAPTRYAGTGLTKTLRIMKIAAVLLLAAGLQVHAAGFSQNITLKMEKASLESVLAELGRQSGYNFVYTGQVLQASEKISVDIRDASLQKALSICLKDLPLTYSIVEKIVIIKPKPLPAAAEPPADTSGQIRGRVLNEEGQPMAGASVKIKGSDAGTSTDNNGFFSIAASGKSVLVFSFIGYTSKETSFGNSPALHIISLSPVDNSLNEVVVTAFGIQKQEKSLGYATSTVSSKELTEAGNTNFASALYGKAAGVTIKTAPGGASSAVNVQIRGINSLSYNKQPLYVVDGIIVRNDGQAGAAGINNGGFYDDQRIRGNGILDINPEDIETLTVLKGASATALYGSDAVGGVIVITTKKGTRGRTPAVDFNYFATSEQAAFLPKYQNVYGQGYDAQTNIAVGASADGTFPDSQSPAGWRPNFRAYANFGPKMDGQKVRWWDGSIRPYSPQPDNYADIFRTGYSSLANVALSNQTENANYRISASRLDYGSIQRESGVHKNTFSLNSTLKFGKKVSVDVVANYVNTLTHDRPYQTNRLAQSFDGFFGREEDTKLVLQKYQTSQGYDWVPYNQTARNPAEAFVFNVRPNLYDYFWSTLKNSDDERESRIYTSTSLNWEIIDHLKFRGRIGNDYTSRSDEGDNYSLYPVAFNTGSASTGAYTIATGIYTVLYGDGLLTYSDKLVKDVNFSISGGFTSRTENYKDQSSSTSNGLVTENWFSLSNSYGILTTSYTRKSLLKYGSFGILDLSYRNYLFVEGTMRQESSSTLPPANNTYYYPSVNSGFVFSDAFPTAMPAFLSYGKLRLSYGVVGNPAALYTSDIAYSQTSLQSINGSVPALTIPSAYGNANLRPEKKYETEAGLELRFLKNRLGADITYYDNKVRDIILPLQIAPSNGAASQIVNAGVIGNRGWEISLNATPSVGAIRWQTRLNFAFDRSKVYSLAPNIPELVFYQGESAIKATAKAGDEIGTIYVMDVQKDSKGNKMVDNNGFYIIDDTKYNKAGSLLPKAVGGLYNSVSYKNFSLSLLVDYRLGGQIISTPLKYGLSGGMYESTLQYRDAAHGGLTYYTDPGGNNIPLPAGSTSAPGGATVYHDGVILPGINPAGQPNTTIMQAATYYFNEFSPGQTLNREGAIYDNSYIKLRELTLGYKLPARMTGKMGMNSLRISLVGRNLLYFWRTLKNLDPETTIGSQWFNQGIDNGSIPSTRSLGVSLNATF